MLPETARLRLRQFNFDDAAFIVRLVNTPAWIKFIGDRNVHNEEQARSYLEHGPMKSYRENGFGLCMVETKDPVVPIGMCGLLKRDSLDSPDIGFAFLPEYTGQGYAFEIAASTLEYARSFLCIEKISAITDAANERSIRLLKKLGMTFERNHSLQSDGKELMVFSMTLRPGTFATDIGAQ